LRKNGRVRALAFGLLLFSWISLELTSGQTSDQQIEQLFHHGQMALRNGEFSRAAEDFKKVLALDPTLLEAEVNLGLAYQGLSDYASAVQHLTKALKERPNLPGPTLIVGLDYLKLGAPEKAIPFLERSLKLDPSNSYAREALASSYLSQEKFGSAADQFRQIAVTNPDKAEAGFKLGHQYLDLAARLAYRGARLYRESAWGHRFLGDLFFQRNRWPDALAEYKKALSSDPQQDGLHTLMGQTHLAAHEFDEAETEFQTALKNAPRDELAWIGLANLRLATNQAKGAIECLAKVWQISPEFLVLQRDFPSVEISRESAKAALSAIESEPDGAGKRYLVAALSGAEFKALHDDFSAWKKTAAAGGHEDPCEARRYSRCIKSLEARARLTVPERLRLAKAQYAMQQYEPAARSFEQIPDNAKDSAEASYWLERSYQALGADAFARVEESFPDSWRTHQLRAESAALRGNVDDAVKEYRTALALHSNEPELYASLGELYLEHHNYSAATSELEKALALDESNAHTLYLLGRVYVETKDNEKAVPYLERALRFQPDLAEANSLLGTAYLRLGRVADSIPRLAKAAPSDHYGNVHYQLYVAYRKLGKAELAQKELVLSQDLRRNALERDQAVIMGSPQQNVEQP
jgi:tetratricopeptide (TPR) repeat protein